MMKYSWGSNIDLGWRPYMIMGSYNDENNFGHWIGFGMVLFN